MQLSNKGQQLEIITEGKVKAGPHRKILLSHGKSLLRIVPKKNLKCFDDASFSSFLFTA